MGKRHRMTRTIKRVFSFSSGFFLVVAIAATASADPGKKVKSIRASAVLPAKISLKTVPMILDPGKIPPEPDATRGKATLTGVDTNKNGIRDDVERWIAQNHPSCARYRAALAQVALSVQRRMVVGDLTDEVATLMAAEESSATACFASEMEACESGSIENFIQFSILLQNTPGRGKAYLKVARSLRKKAVNAEDHGCTIPGDKLSN